MKTLANFWKRKEESSRVKRIPDNIHVNHRLPPEWRLPELDQFFYRIGLNINPEDRPKREKRSFIKPWILVCANLYVLGRSLLILIFPENLTENQKLFFYYLGDISIIVKLRYHFSFLLITFACASLSIMIYHRYLSTKDNIESKIKRQKVDPILLMLGKKKPKDIHLMNRDVLIKLIKRIRAAVNSCNFIRISLISSIPIGYGVCLGYKYVTDNTGPITFVTIAFALVVYTYFSDTFYSFTIYHILYFYIGCEYLKLKMVQTVNILERNAKSASTGNKNALYNAMAGIRELEAIYQKVGNYNQFWSKIIMILFVVFVTNLSFFFFIALFADIGLLVKGLCFSVITIEVNILLVILMNASKIDILKEKVYTAMYSLLASFQWKQYRNMPRTGKMIRVYNLKMENWIETYVDDRLGFTCSPIFTINYYVSFEVVAIMISGFLKLVQMGA